MFIIIFLNINLQRLFWLKNKPTDSVGISNIHRLPYIYHKRREKNQAEIKTKHLNSPVWFASIQRSFLEGLIAPTEHRSAYFHIGFHSRKLTTTKNYRKKKCLYFFFLAIRSLLCVRVSSKHRESKIRLWLWAHLSRPIVFFLYLLFMSVSSKQSTSFALFEVILLGRLYKSEMCGMGEIVAK